MAHSNSIRRTRESSGLQETVLNGVHRLILPSESWRKARIPGIIHADLLTNCGGDLTITNKLSGHTLSGHTIRAHYQGTLYQSTLSGHIAQMNEQLLRALEDKIDDLVGLCGELQQENKLLKSNQLAWQEERVKLREKNELARSRVDKMISRLKSLEQES